MPVLDKNRAPMGPGILSSTGAGVWRKAPMAFPDSSSVLDEFPSAIPPLSVCNQVSNGNSYQGEPGPGQKTAPTPGSRTSAPLD